jgi:hypothetical protein
MEVQQVACMFNSLKVTVAQPYFGHPITDEPVFVIFDVPHLLKCVRNTLMSYDILVSLFYGTKLNNQLVLPHF